jgi:hypothetical protein
MNEAMSKAQCQSVDRSSDTATASPCGEAYDVRNSKKRERESCAASSLGPELTPSNELETVNTRDQTGSKKVSISQLEQLMKAHCEQTERSRAAESYSLNQRAEAALNSEHLILSCGLTGDTQKCNITLQKELEQKALIRMRSMTRKTPSKPFKFDPPTFRYGPSTETKNEDEKPVVITEVPPLKPFDPMNYYDRVSRHHFESSGINWQKREIDLLAEYSTRWIQDMKRRKTSDDREKASVSEADKSSV